ncbi:putative tetratricopeptide tpr repeat protein [Mycena venus]|uniref:Putative tetratricopeptide tpr repeat protein n=1 Tax=Mycena venus TaxID=2733690 RepID=A0A8H7CR96_9AGAR|nr:putative tetratricopeptide tpr repeat protein [Mycena venus]
MLETSKGNHRLSWLNMLAAFKLQHGEYAEAERLEREVLPWMQTHERLGKGSLQALGTTRRIIETMWKQGGSKVEEARRLAEEAAELVKAMGMSKFAKYQEEERQMLRDLMAQLENESES